MLICIFCRIYCVTIVLNVTLPSSMPIVVSSQETPYIMVLNITLCLIYKHRCQQYKRKKKQFMKNTSCTQENTGRWLPLGRRPGRDWRRSLQSLPVGLPRGNNFPYFFESMKYNYNIIHGTILCLYFSACTCPSSIYISNWTKFDWFISSR